MAPVRLLRRNNSRERLLSSRRNEDGPDIERPYCRTLIARWIRPLTDSSVDIR